MIDSKSSVSGTGNINLQSGNNDITVAVKAENGSVRNYVIHVVRQDNGPTYSDSIGSGVNPGSGGGSGAGPGGGPGSGPGGGSSSPSGNSGNPGGSSGGSNVQILPPDGSGSGGIESGSTTGPMAPGGNLSGFGTSSDSSGLVGPGGSTGTPGVSPGGSGSSGVNPGAAGEWKSGCKCRRDSSTACGIPDIIGRGQYCEVYTSSGGEVAGSVGTGNIVQAYGPDGSPVAKYDVIVKGDNTGDGKVNILDVLKAQRHVLGLENLTGVYEKAADVNGNGKVDIMDILAMQKDILGIQKLN